MKMKRLFSILHARNMEFVRDKGAFFWNLVFPLFLVFGFAFAFSGDNDSVFTVGLHGGSVNELAAIASFGNIDHVEFIEYSDVNEAESKLRYHQIDLLIDTGAKTYMLNEQSANGELVEQLLLTQGGDRLTRLTVDGRALRYIDWLVPGVIGMNILFSGLFGVGFVIVRYRKNGVLKRLKATPLTAFEFVTAQVVSRLIIVLFMSVVVFFGTNLFLRFIMLGSYLNLVILTIIAVMSIISLGLIFSSRIKNEELVGGLMNIALWPMIAFSGVFFSLDNAPIVLQRISNVFPLTHYLTAARSIMLEGATIVDVFPNILALIGMTIFFLLVASFMFKWE